METSLYWYIVECINRYLEIGNEDDVETAAILLGAYAVVPSRMNGKLGLERIRLEKFFSMIRDAPFDDEKDDINPLIQIVMKDGSWFQWKAGIVERIVPPNPAAPIGFIEDSENETVAADEDSVSLNG